MYFIYFIYFLGIIVFLSSELFFNYAHQKTLHNLESILDSEFLEIKYQKIWLKNIKLKIIGLLILVFGIILQIYIYGY